MESQCLTDYLDVQIKLEPDVGKTENGEIPSIKIEQTPSIDSSCYSDSNSFDQQSNICLVGEDDIEVNCKKCSTDFSSLKSFLEHLHKKHHENVSLQISKENELPPTKKARVTNSVPILRKKIRIPIIYKATSQSSVQQQQQPVGLTGVKNTQQSTINSNNNNQGSFSRFELDPELDIELESGFLPEPLPSLLADPLSDPLSDPLHITPTDLKHSYRNACPTCGDNFYSFNSLKAHLKKTIPRTACEEWNCSKTFTLNCALLQHKESHRKADDIKANAAKNSTKTYSRANRTYGSKKSIISTTTSDTTFMEIKPNITFNTTDSTDLDIKPDITTTTTTTT